MMSRGRRILQYLENLETQNAMPIESVERNVETNIQEQLLLESEERGLRISQCLENLETQNARPIESVERNVETNIQEQLLLESEESGLRISQCLENLETQNARPVQSVETNVESNIQEQLLESEERVIIGKDFTNENGDDSYIASSKMFLLVPDEELIEALIPVNHQPDMVSLETESLVQNLSISVGDLEQSILINSSSCTYIFSDISTNNIELENNKAKERETDNNSISIVDNDSFAAQSSSSASANTSANLSQEVSRKNITGRPKKGRKRKYPEQNRIVKKTRLNTGQEYINSKGKTVRSKEFQGDHFDCKCPNRCTEKVSAEQRKLEFHKFWSSGSFESRCALIQSFVKQKPKARTYSTTSKRLFTRLYTIGTVSVCKKLFLNTFGISQSRIDIALAKTNPSVPLNDQRGLAVGGLNKISEKKVNEIKTFIDSLPKYKSHYCRNLLTSKFLAPNLNLRILYDLYKEKHSDGVSLSCFKTHFYNCFNLRFKKPHKDTCVRCDVYRAKKKSVAGVELNELETQHNAHLNHASQLRNQLRMDIQHAQDDETIETLTFDLEKTHALPRLPTSIVYYKRQLNLYNFGIHCGSTGRGFFNVWLEMDAGRGCQEVGSCLKKFINEHLKETATELILWSDACGGQNRSIKLVTMLSYILQNHEKLQKITLRFLQPGHTFLPNDSEFGDVECSLKMHNRLYTDDDYIRIMENCRRKKRFTVTKMSKFDFFSVDPLLRAITNRKQDTNKKKISWLKTFEITIKKESPFTLYFNSVANDLSTAQIVDVSKLRKNRKQQTEFKNIELPLLWPDGKPLSIAKVKDLKEMLKLIPSDAKQFYSFLGRVQTSDFIDDLEGYGDTIDFEIENEDGNEDRILKDDDDH